MQGNTPSDHHLLLCRNRLEHLCEIISCRSANYDEKMMTQRDILWRTNYRNEIIIYVGSGKSRRDSYVLGRCRTCCEGKAENSLFPNPRQAIWFANAVIVHSLY